MALLFEFSQSKYTHRQGLAPVEVARRGMAYLVAFQGWRVPGPRRSDGLDVLSRPPSADGVVSLGPAGHGETTLAASDI